MIKLLSQGVYRDFAMSYLDKHRDKITSQWPTFEQFDKYFTLTDSDLEGLKSLATDAGIAYDAEGFELSRELIRNQISAIIAQSVYSTEAFYRWMNPREAEIYKRAVDLMVNWDSKVEPLLEGKR